MFKAGFTLATLQNKNMDITKEKISVSYVVMFLLLCSYYSMFRMSLLCVVHTGNIKYQYSSVSCVFA